MNYANFFQKNILSHFFITFAFVLNLVIPKQMAQFTNPKGTRDMLPNMMAKREYLFKILKKVFENHAFVPIETPAFERMDTLMGKYGEEGDKLLFKILNSGNFLQKAKILDDLYEKSAEELNDTQRKNLQEFTRNISEKGLRYDLTIPMARFVAQHRNELIFPFKRYQIQPVWRADRPQKGRYQEFYQCDVDIIGSNSLWDEIECIQIFDAVFKALNLPVTLVINNRKILEAFITQIGQKDNFEKITNIIDKTDKIGVENAKKELKKLEIDELTQLRIFEFTCLGIDEDSGKIRAAEEQFNMLLTNSLYALSGNKLAEEGIQEMRFILDIVSKNNLSTKIHFSTHLVRGLSYYTGTIFEVIPNDKNVKIGSIAAGGRYDNLTDLFGLKNVSGIGISFGAERIYDVLETLDLFPKKLDYKVDLFFLNFGEEYMQELYPLFSILRQKYSLDFYSRAEKIKKQMNYANDRKAAYVLSYGEDEKKVQKIKIKNMETGVEIEILYSSLSTININSIVW
jgi:histidyl-tRNA synthetase